MTPSDTSAKAHAVQVSLLRAASPAQRCRLAIMLSDTTRHLARQAIDRAHPDIPEQERDLLYLRVHYGADLATRVREYLRHHDLSR